MPVLMCPPTHFGVDYEINPWMHVEVPVDRERASRQWEALRSTYLELGVDVVLAEPRPGLPDMVFTANAAAVRGDRAVLSRFRHPERQGEEELWRALLESRGMRVADAGGLTFEGAGDALFLGDTLVCGYGFRSDPGAIPVVAQALDVEAVAVELVDPRFYHLDTCFCPLDDRTVLLASSALSAESAELVHRLAGRVIEVPPEVATGFACNALAVDRTVISSTAALSLAGPLAELGYRVVGLPMTEFMKAGGGVRCLSLPLAAAASQPSPTGHPAPEPNFRRRG
jgi:N-dimethylarginine dimethylaminohydrolase